MSRIDLNYIRSNYLTQLLAEPLTKETIKELINEVISLINDDLSRSRGYIEKYDNKWDRMEGTDVSPLKQQVYNIETNIKVLTDILLENFQSKKVQK